MRVMLRWKILLAIIGLVAGVMALSGWVLVREQSRASRTEAAALGTGLFYGLSIPMAQEMLYREMELDEDSVAIQTHLKQLVRRTDPEVLWALVGDERGRAAYHTDSRKVGSVLPGGLVEGLRWSGPRIREDRDPETGAPFLEIAGPLAVGTRRVGTLALGISLRNLPRQQLRSAGRSLVMTLCLTGLAVAGALVLSRKLTGPLSTLSREMALVNLDEDHEVRRVDSRDEIGDLFAHFSTMLERLRRSARNLEETRRRMAHSQKLAALGRLAAGVVHEIANPLDGIRNCVVEASQNLADAPRVERYLAMAKEGLTQIERVTRNLLEIARAPRGEIQPLDLAGLLRRTAALVARQFANGNAALELGAVPETLPLSGDPQGLQQVFLNLLLNGLDAAGPGGRVWLEAETAGKEMVIRVFDSGPGVAPEDRERIFEPFFTTKKGSTGTGLGLSVSLGIVQDHGGRIEVGEGPGGGARFDVRIPVREGTVEEP